MKSSGEMDKLPGISFKVTWEKEKNGKLDETRLAGVLTVVDPGDGCVSLTMLYSVLVRMCPG